MWRVLRFNEPATARVTGVIHVRFGGRRHDVALASLGITGACSDREIKRAVALHQDLAAPAFDECIVDRHPNGNLTIRPQAVFG